MEKRRIKNYTHPTIFEEKEVRRVWHDERWYFAVVDVVAILSGSANPQVYWRVLKKRLIDEGSNETVTKCNALKMVAEDGKMRLIDAGNLEVIFRIIQSILFHSKHKISVCPILPKYLFSVKAPTNIDLF